MEIQLAQWFIVTGRNYLHCTLQRLSIVTNRTNVSSAMHTSRVELVSCYLPMTHPTLAWLTIRILIQLSLKLTAQYWVQCNVRTSNSSHVSVRGLPHSCECVQVYEKSKTPPFWGIIGI